MHMMLPSGNPIKYHEGVLSLQPMFPPKRFDNVSLCLGDAQKIPMRSYFSSKAVNVLTIFPPDYGWMP